MTGTLSLQFVLLVDVLPRARLRVTLPKNVQTSVSLALEGG
jgi:hypothetical protein